MFVGYVVQYEVEFVGFVTDASERCRQYNLDSVGHAISPSRDRHKAYASARNINDTTTKHLLTDSVASRFVFACPRVFIAAVQGDLWPFPARAYSL